MNGQITLILGGARSGKSSLAEKLAASGSRVLFVATAEARDEDMARRIAAHRKSRPTAWDTLEEPIDLAGALSTTASRYDTVVIDCLTLWVSNLILKQGVAVSDQEVLGRAESLLKVCRESAPRWIIVTNEVGLGIVPDTPLGRRYRDLLGRVNQVFAREADVAYLVVAGLALDLKAAGARAIGDFSGGMRP